VLPLDRVLERRDEYLVARSPGNATHYWGTLLLFDEPPAEGDAARWERLFDAEVAGDPRVRHRTFAWDRVDGALGAARREFVARGYELEESVGLIGAPEHIRHHPRANPDVRVRALDPLVGHDDALWDQVLELQVAGREATFAEDPYRVYARTRLEDLRAMFRRGRGAWYVALDPGEDEVVGSCGVVVTSGRGRFQAVETAAAHRRRGICSRLVVDAAHDAARQHGAHSLVIAADPGYHALGLYESLGFERRERVCGVFRAPPEAVSA
jgi:ribosomal protein S18 acetylase RimI-like enzyme